MKIRKMPKKEILHLCEFRRRIRKNEELSQEEHQKFQSLTAWEHLVIKKRHMLEERRLDREQREELYE